MTTYNVSDAAISQKCVINNADGLERVFPPLLFSRSATVRVHPPSFRVVVGRGREARPCQSVGLTKPLQKKCCLVLLVLFPATLEGATTLSFLQIVLWIAVAKFSYASLV
jgi:hypothetical protein